MEILTADDVADYLRCSVWFVYRNWRVLGGFKLRKLVRFDKERLDLYIERQKEETDECVPPPGEMEVVRCHEC
jgi:hypothetical protein